MKAAELMSILHVRIRRPTWGPKSAKVFPSFKKLFSKALLNRTVPKNLRGAPFGFEGGFFLGTSKNPSENHFVKSKNFPEKSHSAEETQRKNSGNKMYQKTKRTLFALSFTNNTNIQTLFPVLSSEISKNKTREPSFEMKVFFEKVA